MNPVRRAAVATTAATLPATLAFVVTRNRYELEDAAFVEALTGCSLAAIALAVALAIALGLRRRSLVGVAAVAFLGVPVLYAGYLVVYVVTVCGIAGETCYD